MTGDLPRFTGPAQARKRLRLVTAIGVLAVTGVVTGALASLGGRGPTRAPEVSADPPQPRAPGSETPELLDLAMLVEVRVVGAEAAMVRARAAVRSAQQLGLLDAQLLEEFERRLDRVGGDSSSATPVPQRSHQPPPSSSPQRLSLDGSPRGL